MTPTAESGSTADAGRTGPPGTSSGSRTYVPFLDLARILAILGVVGIHTLAGGVADGSVGLLGLILNMTLTCSVPVFFMISGALTLDPRSHRAGPGEFLRRRAVRVLPALVIWSAFYMVVISGWVSGQQWTPSTVLDRIVTGQTYTHLYFLWAITGLYLLSPLIEAFLRPAEGRRAWVLGLGACAWTLVSMALPHLTADASTPEREPVQTTSLTYALVYAGYYILGRAALVAPIPKRWARVCLGLAVPVVAGIVLLKVRVVDGQAADAGPIEQSLVPSYVSPMVMLYAVLVFAAASSLLQDRRVGPGTQKVLRLFGNATFGVYLVHFAVIVLLRQIPALEDYTAGAMLAVYTVTVLVSTAFALLASRVPGLRLIV